MTKKEVYTISGNPEVKGKRRIWISTLD